MNWGWKIALGYSAFVVFILFMVYSANQVKFQLVTPDYYSAEIAFQGQIDKLRSAQESGNNVEIYVESDGLALHFNNFNQTSAITGKAYFFRPSESGLDREFHWEMNEAGMMFLEKSHFSRGLYTFKLDGVVDGEAFYVEKPVFIP